MSRIKGNILRIKDFSFFIPTEMKDIKELKFNNKIILITTNKKDFSPKICIVEEKSEPDYDYDYEDNLTYIGENTETFYYPIEYNPYDGTKIEFIVQEVINLTEQYEDIINRMEETEKMRSSSKKTNLLNELSKEIDLLLKDVPICLYYNEENRYSLDDQLYLGNLL